MTAPRPTRTFSLIAKNANIAYTLRAEGLFRELISPCLIGKPFNRGSPEPRKQKFDAQWDSGATGTGISERVVSACGPSPIRKVQSIGTHGSQATDLYAISILLPNGLGYSSLEVASYNIGRGHDVLIGMNLITLCDFSITNVGGNTVFSIRFPSIATIDYEVPE